MNIFIIKAFNKENSEVYVNYVQQAAAAKTIGILVKLSNQIAEQILGVTLFTSLYINIYNYIKFEKLQVIHSLLYTMGNEEYADSQRQASKTLEVLFQQIPHVNKLIKSKFNLSFL